jgi:Glycosyltransferase
MSSVNKNRLEMEQLKQQIKRKITELIENNDFEQANLLIGQYETMISTDPDIYTFKGIIPFIQGDYRKAEQWFKEGLSLANDHFDLLYNLAYISEQLGNQEGAYRYYRRALNNCSAIEMRAEIEQVLVRLEGQGISGGASQLRKKVLVLSHRFPPVAGSGVQRTLKFVKYIREFGWEPVVVTVGATRYPLHDISLIKELPEEIKIIRVDEPDTDHTENFSQKLMEAYGHIIDKREILAEFSRAVGEGKVSILQPDPYIMWGLRVVQELQEKIDFNEIDMLYSTSGPYTDHVIGLMLKQIYQVPWVADFRDEWTNNAFAQYDKNSILYRVHYAMEERIVKLADHVLTTTSMASESYIDQFQLAYSKVSTITNGYDEEDFSFTRTQGRNEKFTLFHNGILYLIRTPLTLFQAVSNLITAGKVDPNKLRIGLTWTEDEEVWKEAANRLGLQDIVEFHGYLSHQESLAKANESDALALIVGSGEKNKAIYPGKVFEYLRLNKPILALSPAESLVDHLVTELGRGVNVDFDDVSGIEAAFLELYVQWREDRLPHFKTNEQVQQYERRNQTQALVSRFEHVLEYRKNQSQKTKLCFFSIKDGDKFLNETIEHMSHYYNVRKVIVNDPSQIDEGMKWADICWFEWCDRSLEYASHSPLAEEKKIVCRLHSYEAFSDHPNQVNWSNVDELILVSNSVAPILETRFPELSQKVRVTIIPNGVNLEKYKFTCRKKGYNIAFVGYMIPHKNPMLLLQVAKQLIEREPKYKFFIAGEFKDAKLKLYWEYMVREMDLEKNVFFEGYQADMGHFLSDKQYLISTTMYESFGYGIAEAMASGIKPIIHNYPYSKETWPDKYLFTTIEQAIAQFVNDEYDSLSYRRYIQDNYSLEKQLELTRELLNRCIK